MEAGWNLLCGLLPVCQICNCPQSHFLSDKQGFYMEPIRFTLFPHRSASQRLLSMWHKAFVWICWMRALRKTIMGETQTWRKCSCLAVKDWAEDAETTQLRAASAFKASWHIKKRSVLPQTVARWNFKKKKGNLGFSNQTPAFLISVTLTFICDSKHFLLCSSERMMVYIFRSMRPIFFTFKNDLYLHGHLMTFWTKCPQKLGEYFSLVATLQFKWIYVYSSITQHSCRSGLHTGKCPKA